MKLYFSLFLIYFSCFSKTVCQPIFGIKGIINQKNTIKPIPYANIYLLNGNHGIVSDESGYFVWNWPTNKSDTLVISCIGYKSQLIPASSFLNTSNLSILLDEITYDLPEIKVKKRNKSYCLGSKLSKNNIGYGECINSSYEVVLLIKGDDSKSGVFSKVGYFISDFGKPSTPFRVRLYKNDGGAPGEEIVFGNLIATAKSGGKWFDIDVLDYYITFPSEGVFVGMEWLVMDNEKYYYDMQFVNNQDERKERRRCFGQRLGFTNEFDEPLGWIRRNFKQWRPLWQNPNKNPINNPMVRAEIKF